jgi:hypothetical protein
MPADPQTVQLIRRLALKPDVVWPAPQVVSDLMAYNLTMDDICDAIVDWIDNNERIKPDPDQELPQPRGTVGFRDETEDRRDHLVHQDRH